MVCFIVSLARKQARARSKGTEDAKSEALKGLSPEVQWLYSLCFICECLERHPGRRRFLLQEKTGQEVLIIDFLDPALTCPKDQVGGWVGR